ncbi:unnamed protein product [Amoebophrya sp. A25]|nr:unnamed protein product [Amoebophrya sp. A25]|eukprot:GSA25T00025764001.1
MAAAASSASRSLVRPHLQQHVGAVVPWQRAREPLRSVRGSEGNDVDRDQRIDRLIADADASSSAASCSSERNNEAKQWNREPAAHLVRLAEALQALSPDELKALEKECRNRLSVTPATQIRGLSSRSPFPHPRTFFRGENGMRTLPIGYSVFGSGISLPPVSMFFGAKAPSGGSPPAASQVETSAASKGTKR